MPPSPVINFFNYPELELGTVLGAGTGQCWAGGLSGARPLPGPPHHRAESGTAWSRDAGSRDPGAGIPGTGSPGAGIPEVGTPEAGMAEVGWERGSQKVGCWGRRSRERGPRSGEGSGVPRPHRSPCGCGSAAADSFGLGSPRGGGADDRAGVPEGPPRLPAGSLTGGVSEQPCRGGCGTGPP